MSVGIGIGLELKHTFGESSNVSSFIQTISPAQLIMLHPLDDAQGNTAREKVNSPLQDGTYSGVTLFGDKGPDGIINSPTFDGTNSYVDFFFSSIDNVFNTAEFTIDFDAKYTGSWTDGLSRRFLHMLDDSQNQIYLRKHTTNNRFQVVREAQNINELIEHNGINTNDWFHITFTNSLLLDELKLFIDGTQSGTTQTGMLTMNGDGFQTNAVLFGAIDKSDSEGLTGSLSSVAMWNKALLQPQIDELNARIHSSYIQRGIGLTPIAYWPLIGDATDEIDSPNQDGTATGVTFDATGPISGETTAASFDGVNDYIDIYSSNLNTAFDGAEGTMLVWAKVSSDSVWTDGVSVYIFKIEVNDSHNIRITKAAANNTVGIKYEANDVVDSYALTISDTGWNLYSITWSATADEVKAYHNGVLMNTATGLGVWAGSLGSTKCIIGAFDTAGTEVFDGDIAHAKVYDRPLTADEVAYCYMHTTPFLTEYQDEIKDIDLPALILQTNLDDTSGTVAINYQGDTTKDGLLVNPVFDSELFADNSPTILLNGSTAYIDLFTSKLGTDFDGDEGTIIGWVKMTNAASWNDGSQYRILEINTDANNNLFLDKNTSDQLQFTREGTSVVVDSISPISTPTDTLWHHVAIVWSITDDYQALFMDGLLRDSDNTLTAWTGAATTATLGRAATTATLYWPGRIHKMQLYNRRLTVTEINYHYETL